MPHQLARIPICNAGCPRMAVVHSTVWIFASSAALMSRAWWIRRSPKNAHGVLVRVVRRLQRALPWVLLVALAVAEPVPDHELQPRGSQEVERRRRLELITCH